MGGEQGIGEKKIKSFGTSFVPFFSPLPSQESVSCVCREIELVVKGRKKAAAKFGLSRTAVFKTSFLGVSPFFL